MILNSSTGCGVEKLGWLYVRPISCVNMHLIIILQHRTCILCKSCQQYSRSSSCANLEHDGVSCVPQELTYSQQTCRIYRHLQSHAAVRMLFRASKTHSFRCG